jgi:hypothetical protein
MKGSLNNYTAYGDVRQGRDEALSSAANISCKKMSQVFQEPLHVLYFSIN